MNPARIHPDLADVPVIELDMDAIYRAATGRKGWRIEFDCDGAPFIWTGDAASSAAAELQARRELSDKHAAFDRFGARLVALELQR